MDQEKDQIDDKTERSQNLQERIATFPYWYHKIELPGGIVTPGWAPLDEASYSIPETLAGKRVLDVGAWDGYWTFEALKRGAREVVAIDDFQNSQQSQRRGWETFDLCREALGYSEDVCKRINMSVYEVSEDRLGRFDVIFFFGTFYHMRYPLLVLDKLSVVCDGELYVESAILDDYSPYQGGIGHGYPGKQMLMEFYPSNEYGNDVTSYWVPTLNCLTHMVGAAGFRQVLSWKLVDQAETLPLCRGFVVGSKSLPSETEEQL